MSLKNCQIEIDFRSNVSPSVYPRPRRLPFHSSCRLRADRLYRGTILHLFSLQCDSTNSNRQRYYNKAYIIVRHITINTKSQLDRTRRRKTIENTFSRKIHTAGMKKNSRITVSISYRARFRAIFPFPTISPRIFIHSFATCIDTQAKQFTCYFAARRG